MEQGENKAASSVTDSVICYYSNLTSNDYDATCISRMRLKPKGPGDTHVPYIRKLDLNEQRRTLGASQRIK